MRKWIVWIGVGTLFGMHSALQAAPLNPAMESQRAEQSVNAGRLAEARSILERVLEHTTPFASANQLQGILHLREGRLIEARRQFDLSSTVEPDASRAWGGLALLAQIEGDAGKAKSLYGEALMLIGKDADWENLQRDLEQTARQYAGKPQEAGLSALLTWLRQEYGRAPRYFRNGLPGFLQGIGAIQRGDPNAGFRASNDFAAQLKRYPQPPKRAIVFIYEVTGAIMRNAGLQNQAIEAWTTGDRYRRSESLQYPYMAARLLANMAGTLMAQGHLDRARSLIAEAVQEARKQPAESMLAEALLMRARVELAAGQESAARSTALEALVVAERARAQFFVMDAKIMLSGVYGVTQTKADRLQALRYGEDGLAIARQREDAGAIDAVQGNLAIAYWQQGQRERSVTLYREQASRQRNQQRYTDALLTLNNLGAMHYAISDFAGAARVFEDAVSLAEQERGKLAQQDRVAFLGQQLSAYQFLAGAQARLGRGEALLKTQEMARARVLGERLAKGRPTQSVSTYAEVRSLLRPKEAALVYTQMDAYSVVIHLVTADRAIPLYRESEAFIKQLRNSYLDRRGAPLAANASDNQRALKAIKVKPAVVVSPSPPVAFIPADDEGEASYSSSQIHLRAAIQLLRDSLQDAENAALKPVTDDLLRAFYGQYIQPVEANLLGIERLLIVLDGALHQLPFEVFKGTDGRYLAERFAIRYAPSFGSLKQLQQRRSTPPSRPLLGVGGATYSALPTGVAPINNAAALNALRLEFENNRTQRRSQRRVYAALLGSEPLAPLPGTLTEVNALAEAMPGSTSLTGADASENRIKQLSRTGELAQYRFVHIATHGFAIGKVPEMSGIAMSLPTQEVGGEDGLLDMQEIASLRLNADLTVLSACETALGKVAGGEGVLGLSQSLLQAGSNAAVLSLWPVSDDATQAFMSALYKDGLTASDSSYADAIASLKQRFIKGEFGERWRHPYYWSAFVYQGLSR